MLSQLDLYLNSFNTDAIMSSLATKLHGFLFHALDSKQADIFHQMRLNPFSLFVFPIQKGYVLRVSALTDYAEVILDCFEKYREIPIFGTDEILTVRNSVRHTAVKPNEAADELDRQINGGKLVLHFVTPTAWKAERRYRNYPDIGKLFKPVVNKMNIFERMMLDEEECCGLFNKLTIEEFGFHSCHYRITKDRIPSFTGSITVSPERNKAEYKLLTQIIAYAAYSGVGIKTSLGMGGLLISTES